MGSGDVLWRGHVGVYFKCKANDFFYITLAYIKYTPKYIGCLTFAISKRNAICTSAECT
jgi:hypothetical protein